MKTQNIFLACPTHNGLIDHRTARSIYQTASQRHNLLIMVMQNSLLANGCNQMYCHALNNRHAKDLKWFAMIHADIIPDPNWLDTLITIAENENADMLSAIVPIKDERGLTSTAISQDVLAEDSHFGCFARLTTKQVKALPETFDIHTLKEALESKVLPELRIDNIGDTKRLLLNTGCMITRLDRPWSDQVSFNITDRIQRRFNQYHAEVEPEDWAFSRLVGEAGGNVMATRAVTVNHIGTSSYISSNVWGENVDPIVPQTHLVK